MKYHLLSYLAGPAVWRACGFGAEMDFLRVAFEGDNSRVCRVALNALRSAGCRVAPKGGRP